MGAATRVGALALLTLLVPSEAFAEAAGAAELYREGVEAYGTGAYDDAASLFRLSYEMDPRAATMCNLATTYDDWGGHEAQALEAYRRCAEEDASGRFQAHALQRAAELRRTLQLERPPVAPPGQGPSTVQGTVRPVPPQRPETEPPVRQPTRPSRSHRLLWGGLAVSGVALACIGIGAGLHSWTAGIHDDLQSAYPDGGPIPAGSADAERLDRGRSGVAAALGMYILGGIFAAAAAVLIGLDFLAPSDGATSFVLASPLPSGVATSVVLRY